jgi:predicted hotdog family 3-hydroxylacyl-ACP dehydratase
MQLVDALLDDGDEFARVETTVRRDAMFVTEEGWPGWVGAELMAQTVAAWGGLQRLKNQKKVQLGFLLGARRYECSIPVFPVGARLEILGKIELISEQGLAVFDCAIFMNGEPVPVATANLNVFQPPDITEYLKAARS